MGAETAPARIGNKALARILFFDGESLLARGDAREAIVQFREAIRNDNQNDHYYYQLAQVLALERSTRSEAEQLLLQAITLNGKKSDYFSQLGLIYIMTGQKEKADKALSMALSIEAKSEVPDQEKERKLELGPRLQVPIQKKELKLEAPKQKKEPKIEVPKQKKNGQIEPKISTKKRIQKRLVKKEWVIGRPTFTVVNIIVFALTGAFFLAAISFAYKTNRIEIRPLIPQDHATIENTKMEFRWFSSVENTDFVIQIELNGEKLIERYTRESMYVPTREELKKFKPGYRYKWRVVPISAKRQNLSYKTSERDFGISVAE